MASNRENKREQLKKVDDEFNSIYSLFSKDTIKTIVDNIDDPKLGAIIIDLFTSGEYAAVMATIVANNVLLAIELGYAGKIEFRNGDELTKKMLTRSWVDDKITASKRIKRAPPRVGRAVANDIVTAVREGDSNRKITKSMKKRIDKGELDSEPIRKDITKLSRKTKDPQTMLEVKRLRKELEKGQSTKLKKAYTRFLNAFESQNEERIKKAIDNAVNTKAKYVANRIARTETNRAWTEGFHLKWKDDEDVVGYGWRLSSGHEIFDQCDVYANTDFGMGKGVFPAGRIPTQPAHPNCNCYLVPIYDGDKKDFNIKNGQKQVERLPEKQKSLLMGEKNRKLFNSGKITYDKAVKGFEKPQPIKTRVVENDIK